MPRALMCCFLFVLFVSDAAWAHRLYLFAWVEENEVRVESVFSGGRPAKGAQIEVRQVSDSSLLATGQTDAQGNWAFPLPPEIRKNPVDIQLVINAGEGHRGEWVLKAADFAEEEDGGALIDERQGPGIGRILAGVVILLGLGLGIQRVRRNR